MGICKWQIDWGEHSSSQELVKSDEGSICWVLLTTVRKQNTRRLYLERLGIHSMNYSSLSLIPPWAFFMFLSCLWVFAPGTRLQKPCTPGWDMTPRCFNNRIVMGTQIDTAANAREFHTGLEWCFPKWPLARNPIQFIFIYTVFVAIKIAFRCFPETQYMTPIQAKAAWRTPK